MNVTPNEETAAICGLFCGSCPMYPDDCRGCLSNKVASFCKTCPNGFRDCARSHGIKRCFECDKFPCERLEIFTKEHYVNGIGHHENVINDLYVMKEGGVSAWVEKKTAECTCHKCGCIIYWMDKENHEC